MVVKIRLARFGRKHAPFYNIVVAQARTARNSKPMEVIGTYDPIPKGPLDGVGRKYKDVQLDSARVKYWLGVGAQPTEPMWKLLALVGFIEPKYRTGMTTSQSRAPEITQDPVDFAREEAAWAIEKRQRHQEERLKQGPEKKISPEEAAKAKKAEEDAFKALSPKQQSEYTIKKATERRNKRLAAEAEKKRWIEEWRSKNSDEAIEAQKTLLQTRQKELLEAETDLESPEAKERLQAGGEKILREVIGSL